MTTATRDFTRDFWFIIRLSKAGPINAAIAALSDDDLEQYLTYCARFHHHGYFNRGHREQRKRAKRKGSA